ncbi:hypothetical protein ACHHYP_00523 [Achlya hypogyna]|uniref:Uncharacterized protein n=1 Tax=Achlya hypogyna TaxID=1202772 RepID=A0A1V9ZV29_ACHHY|nr:hypothetical protein ACHHYP_00523 [Achlya hypogyna]
MNPNRSSVPCVGCNRLFFPASLPIHQKTCFAQNAFVALPCPTCTKTLRTGNYFNHVKNCTDEPVAEAPPRQALVSRDSGPIGPVEADGRIKCRKCRRGFAPDRIAKHQSVCHEAERIKYVRDDENQVHNPPRWVPPPKLRAPRQPPASIHAYREQVVELPPHRSSMPALHAYRKAPYDLVLRDASNQRGYGGAKAGGIDTSNRTSAGNPLCFSR